MNTATEAAEAPRIPQPELAEGETYIGSIITKTERYHLILLPGDNDPENQDDQLAWAKSLNGDLPNRLESAMLYREAKDQFENDWYWTNEIAAEDPDYAWYQCFGNGHQDWLSRSNKLRARAVRRISF
ncbi:hypothetical protein ACW4YW_15195 [Methylobacillus pratensis]